MYKNTPKFEPGITRAEDFLAKSRFLVFRFPLANPNKSHVRAKKS
jgi:hypothetical protein